MFKTIKRSGKKYRVWEERNCKIDFQTKQIKLMEEINMVKKVVEKTLDLPEGEYTGKIVENKIAVNQGYEYHETHIEVEAEGNPMVRIGMPFQITTKTKLGMCLEKFGAKLETGKDVDTDDYLKKDLKVKFSLMKKKKNDAEFLVISPDTFRPAEEKEEEKKE